MRSRGVKKNQITKKAGQIESNFLVWFRFEFLKTEIFRFQCPTQKHRPNRNQTEIY